MDNSRKFHIETYLIEDYTSYRIKSFTVRYIQYIYNIFLIHSSSFLNCLDALLDNSETGLSQIPTPTTGETLPFLA